MKRRSTIALLLVLATTLATSALSLGGRPVAAQAEGPAEVAVVTSGGLAAAYDRLAPQFEAATGIRLVTAYGASTGGAPDSIPVRLARGERFDVLIMSQAGLNVLTAQGLVRPDTRRDLASSSIGMAVREGAPLPDIRTPEAFADTLLAAESIGYSASVSGTYISTELFPKLGLAEQLAPKSRRIVSERVAAVVARGEVEIGFQQVSEILSIEGAAYAGPIPDEYQRVTTFSTGIATSAENPDGARRLIEFLSSDDAARTIAETGLIGVATTHAQEADLVSLQADPAQWVMPNGNYAAWNYSPLDQITVDNVRDLSVAWTFPLPILDSHQAAPLVVGDTMYVVTPKPNRVYALDLGRDGFVKWEFRADLEDLELATERACCGAQTRGLAYADGKLFFNTLDGQATALDASTGELLWQDDPTDYPVSEVRTGAPLVAGRNVIFGVSGGDRGVRGHVTAYDVDTGEVRWRYHNLGPNADVGIGSRFRPFYADDRIPNPALDSWFGDSWRLGGGAVWGWFSYDPDLNYVYYGTGNCGPWNPDYRREWGVIDLDEHGGLATYRNNYCASVLARDATTGELIWAYNVTPQDQWDLDEISAGVLVDLELGGETRRALIRASRNGYFYVLDRATGELLAEPWAFAPNDIMQGVDRETGRARYNIDKINFTDLEDRRRYLPDAESTNVAWCPGIWARNWQNDAYSPRTGLLYTSTSNRCGAMRVVEGEFVPGERYNLRASGGPPQPSPRGDHVDELQANDPVSGRTVWRVEWPTGNNTPVMATAGDLVFQGGSDQGVLRAFDARTGDIVWTFGTGTGFQSSAISYLGPDGRQYVAIVGSSRPGDPTVALDTPADAATRYRREGTMLYVFALRP